MAEHRDRGARGQKLEREIAGSRLQLSTIAPQSSKLRSAVPGTLSAFLRKNFVRHSWVANTKL